MEPDGLWLIYFHDKDVQPEVFAGEGAEDAARRRYDQVSTGYNCHLMGEVRVDPRRPDPLQGTLDV